MNDLLPHPGADRPRPRPAVAHLYPVLQPTAPFKNQTHTLYSIVIQEFYCTFKLLFLYQYQILYENNDQRFELIHNIITSMSKVCTMTSCPIGYSHELNIVVQC